MDYDILYEFRKPEKKRDFAKGVWIGMLIGLVLFAILAFVGVWFYCRISGYNLVLGRHGIAKTYDNVLLDDKTVEKLDELVSYMDIYYYEDYDLSTARNDMYAGLIKGLDDRYSVYYTKEEYDALRESTSGTYYGIGAGLKQDTATMQVTVSAVYEGTPSEEVGLVENDQILSVDGIDATSMELSKLVELIRGEEGTTVHLEIYRESTQETLEFDVERRNVQLPNVSSEILNGNIGYIQIDEFTGSTLAQFREHLKALEDNGMEGLIVDLRGNPGGLLNSVVSILDDILPEGTLVYTEDKYGARETYTSDRNCINYPLVVLVDENSASASEIFAGAIKDYNYGTLVGTTTYGKGIVQSIYPLEDGDALKLTTSKYFTPNGNNIHEIGITPDIELEFEYSGPVDEPYSMEYDNQLQKAIEVMEDELQS